MRSLFSGRLLAAFFRRKGGGGKVEHGHDGGQVARGHRPSGQKPAHLPAHLGQCGARQFGLVQADGANVEQQAIGHGFRNSVRFIEPSDLAWHRWNGSCWEPEPATPAAPRATHSIGTFIAFASLCVLALPLLVLA